MARIGAAHGRLTDADAWLEGFGWDVDQWGRWPTPTTSSVWRLVGVSRCGRTTITVCSSATPRCRRRDWARPRRTRQGA